LFAHLLTNSQESRQIAPLMNFEDAKLVLVVVVGWAKAGLNIATNLLAVSPVVAKS